MQAHQISLLDRPIETEQSNTNYDLCFSY